jgi:hypothetical protein
VRGEHSIGKHAGPGFVPAIAHVAPRPRSGPVDRVLDLSNNAFSGSVFPLWLLEAIPRESADCSGCTITVKGGSLRGGLQRWARFSVGSQAPRRWLRRLPQPAFGQRMRRPRASLNPCSERARGAPGVPQRGAGGAVPAAAARGEEHPRQVQVRAGAAPVGLCFREETACGPVQAGRAMWFPRVQPTDGKPTLADACALLPLRSFMCTATDGSQKPVLDALDGSSPGSMDRLPDAVPPSGTVAPTGGGPDDVGVSSGGGGGSGKGGMRPGAIAGEAACLWDAFCPRCAPPQR